MQQPPCLRLKALRERAGLSGDECVTAWRHYKDKHNLRRRGKRSASSDPAPSSWYRYENPAIMGDKPIDHDVILALIPLMVGRGAPPVTEGELLALSDQRSAEHARLPRVPANASHLGPALSVVKAGRRNGERMPIRLRAEQGVFVEAPTISDKTYGLSNICADEDTDFAVVVADSHAYPTYPPGTVLHCKPFQMMQGLKGSRVLVFVERNGSGLGELLVGHVTSVQGNDPVMKMVDGSALLGAVVGTIKGHYSSD